MKQFSTYNAPKEENVATLAPAPRRNRFTPIPNQLLRDGRLRPDTTWLICLLLSYPDNWQTSFVALQKTKERNIGRDLLRAMIRNAIECGYMVRYRYRLRSGRFSWRYLAFESPEECEIWKRENNYSELSHITIDGKTLYGEVATIDGKTVGGLPVDILNTDPTNTEKIKEKREEENPLSADKVFLEEEEELADNEEDLIPDDVAEKIAARCQEIEKLNSLVEASPQISSALLPEKEGISEPQPESKSWIKKIAPRLFPRKTENNNSPTKENKLLPQYRSQPGAGGIKDEYLDAIATYLTSTPHYQEQKLKADRVDAKRYVLHKEDNGRQELLEEMYRKYCLKQKSSGAEAVSTPRPAPNYDDVEDNLYCLPKVWKRK